MNQALQLHRNISDRLAQSCATSFIDAAVSSEDDLRADMLSNIPGRHKVLEDIEAELRSCRRFDIAVAFVTMGGLTPLLQVLKELEEQGVPGCVLTTDYLTFSDPRAIRRLMGLGNVETRVYRTRQGADGFHTKGWLFENGDVCRFIIGSSNLTDKALTVSREWNTRLVCHRNGALARTVRSAFEDLWNDAQTRPAQEVIDAYEQAWKTRPRPAAPALPRLLPSLPEPNAMQQAFLASLEKSLAEGRRRALLISATGTGKTFAAAFAVRRIQPTRVLFLVHREQIARQAMASFRRVLGGPASDFGLVAQGSAAQADRRYVFATIQTVVRRLDEEELQPDSFDLIIVDEVHRAGAESYERVMRHFRPKLWLGMTGSPDRPDGYDIYALFEHNIVHEIRLQTALENDLLCPFHYFGIGELGILQDGQHRTLRGSDFIRLDSDEMARRVVEKSEFYGWSGPRVKGLVFCTDTAHAVETAAGLQRQGRRALALGGNDSQEARLDAVRRLTQDEGQDCLDYLVTVDIFNEGVDIPEVNQILFLRPTKSPIIFVQQLGRGLRKYPGKDYVVVLDFIANCDTNYLIPVALSGDRSYTKERMRRTVVGERLPGISTIHFDRVARERIYQAIDRANTNQLSLLRESYFMLKRKLGRIPGLGDFEEHGQVDAVKYFSKEAGWSWYNFLVKTDEEYAVRLGADAQRRLVWVSRKLGTGVRPSEAMVLEAIVAMVQENWEGGDIDLRAVLAERLERDCGFACTERHLKSVEAMLTGRFEFTPQALQANADMAFLDVDGEGAWKSAPGFVRTLREDAAFAPMLRELLAFILRRWQRLYAERYEDTMLCLGRTYTYDDVCRLLEWDVPASPQIIGGYRYEQGSETLPVFINYDKPDDAIAYADRFVSRSELIHLSKTNRRADSVDAQRMTRQSPYEKTRVHLFVRRNKNDNQAKGFYYLGEMDAVGSPWEVQVQANDGSAPKPAFEIRWRLRRSVEPGLYSYLTTQGENI